MPPDASRLTGEEGRDFDCGWGAMKGLVVSNGPVEDLDFVGAPGRELRLVGEPNETLFIPVKIDGVKGVFASDRVRCREGVFGWLYIDSRCLQ
jgi:hypothetical protein